MAFDKFAKFIRDNGTIYRFAVPVLQWLNIKNVYPTTQTPFDVKVDTGDGRGAVSRFRVENNQVAGPTDINVRDAVLNVGVFDTSLDESGTKIVMEHVAGSTANFIEVYKAGTGLGGTGATAARVNWRLNSGGGMVSAVGGIATNAWQINNSDGTEARNRFVVDEHGKQTWGDGTNLLVTNLYRQADWQLQTDGQFIAVDGVATKVKAGTPSDSDFQTTPPLGTLVVDTSANKLWARVGSNVWKSTALT